jgi:AraC-like DNA-binding protein
MFAYYMRKTEDCGVASEKYISVNTFGYCEDRTDMQIRREHGRLDYQLIYVKSGELIIHEEDKSVTMGAGELCLFRPGEPQFYSIYLTPTAFFWIHFSGAEAERMLSFFKERRYFVGAFPEFEEYCHGARDSFHSGEAFADLFFEGGLIALIARIAEHICGDPRAHSEFLKIRKAVALMNAEPWNRRKNEELAGLCHLSRNHFEKIFKHAMSVSPHQYYIRLIVDRGKHLLSTTSYTIGEISRHCGIDDALYFSRLFKKILGMSPAAYRKTVAQGGTP